MNPILKKLGFDAGDRVVILHADDIGACQASVDAYGDLLEFGIMSSAATMVPCPWYPAAEEAFRKYREHQRFDVGVHLTLNSEWDTVRWGPLSTRDANSGLLDEAGYFHARTEPTRENARLEAVEQELTAQTERALAGGYDVTHVDTHMLACLHERLLPIYLRVAERFGLPAFVLRPGAEFANELPERIQTMLYEAQERGMPLFDRFDAFRLDDHRRRLSEAKRALDDLPAGLSAVVFHPVRKSPEVQATSKDWKCRVADRNVMMSERLRKVVAASGVRVIGYGVLRDAMRAGH